MLQTIGVVEVPINSKTTTLNSYFTLTSNSRHVEVFTSGMQSSKKFASGDEMRLVAVTMKKKMQGPFLVMLNTLLFSYKLS